MKETKGNDRSEENEVAGTGKLTEDDLTGTNHGELYANSPLKYLTASSILNDKVHNNNDEHLGHIKDIMLDIVTGKISYFIIEFGGLLGIGVKYFAIPFGMLHVDPKRKLFILHQERKMLEQAPGFDIDHWPDTNVHFEKVNSYWGFMG